MIASISIPDPTTALMLANLDLAPGGRVRMREDLRRAQRRYQRRMRLRKLLA